MSDVLSRPCTAFAGHQMIAAGSLIDVALTVKASLASAILVFDDTTGAVVDLDLRGTTADIVNRLTERSVSFATRAGANRQTEPAEGIQLTSPGRGRPRLGVIAREVTLLPRHWEWLATRPGGASQALRRLVDEARRSTGQQDGIRSSREAAYRFMGALAGNLPGFEEALRALFAGDLDRFRVHTAPWPADLRAYAIKLASGPAAANAGQAGKEDPAGSDGATEAAIPPDPAIPPPSWS